MRIYLFFKLALLIPMISGNGNRLNEDVFLKLLNNIFVPQMKEFNLITFTRNIAIITNAAYDALVAYLPNSNGVYSNIAKRPEEERTEGNKNIAIAYAMYRAGIVQLPEARVNLEILLGSLGLDPNEQTLDLGSPIGIGNFAAEQVLKNRLHDGSNQLGDLSGKKYNRRPYEDYTNYVPKNTAYELRYPGRWQPDIVLARRDGLYTIQTNVLPQYRLVMPYLLNVRKYTTPVPTASDPSNKAAYKQQVDEVLKISSELNDYRKMVAELFDQEFMALYDPLMFLIEKNKLNQDEIVRLVFSVYMVLFDTTITIIKEKNRYDTVRPLSAIRYLYNNTAFRAWGGPGVGTVDDITGREWISYIKASSAEYPSGASTSCASFFTFLKNYFKTDILDYRVVREKGSSVVESGITPSHEITLGPYKTFDAIINECGVSRQWGGVHFSAAVIEGRKMGKIIGKDGYEAAVKLFLKSTN